MTALKPVVNPASMEAASRAGSWPVGVPDRAGQRLVSMAQEPPKKWNIAMLLDDSVTPLRVEGITRDLGFSLEMDRSWTQFLENALQAAGNTVVLRRMIWDRAREQNVDPVVRRILMQRAGKYYETLERSLVEVVTVDELCKADPRGGKYYRRTARSGGKGYNYYYTKESYDRSKGKHVEGESALATRISKAVETIIENSGKAGCKAEAFKALTQRYGAKAVGAALKRCVADKRATFKKGRFIPVLHEEIDKSLRFYVRG